MSRCSEHYPSNFKKDNWQEVWEKHWQEKKPAFGLEGKVEALEDLSKIIFEVTHNTEKDNLWRHCDVRIFIPWLEGYKEIDSQSMVHELLRLIRSVDIRNIEVRIIETDKSITLMSKIQASTEEDSELIIKRLVK